MSYPIWDKLEKQMTSISHSEAQITLCDAHVLTKMLMQNSRLFGWLLKGASLGVFKNTTQEHMSQSCESLGNISQVFVFLQEVSQLPETWHL